MTMVHVLEGEVRSKHGWASRIQVSTKDVEDLIAAKILRPQNEDLRLSFVGLLAYPSHVVYSRPKFACDTTFSLQMTISVLRRYFGRGGNRKAVLGSHRDPEFPERTSLREFDIANELDSWFKTHGIYRREYQRLGSIGRTHWPRTIASQQPLHIQESIIYPRLVAERREGAFNEISSLQLGVTRALLQKYEIPVEGGLRHAWLAVGPMTGTWPLGELDSAYYLRRLDSERRTVFRSDTLRLLSALRGALMVVPGRATQPRIFGTTAFYAVWEDACRMLFDARACVLPMVNPVWTVADNRGGLGAVEHDQIPDIIFSGERSVYIADAKYYWPFPVARPGISDIVKQVYYAETSESSSPIRSLFILPSTQNLKPTLLGCTRIESSRRPFPTIEAWGIDPTLVLSNYALGRFEDTDHFVSEIDRGTRQVAEVLGQAPATIGIESLRA
jgi:hypothetical protein